MYILYFFFYTEVSSQDDEKAQADNRSRTTVRKCIDEEQYKLHQVNYMISSTSSEPGKYFQIPL